MKRLVNYYNGEAWFDNPQLIVANSPKRKRRMTMRKVRRNRRHRKNFYGSGMVNRKRHRRSFRSNVHHRRRRRAFRLNRKHHRRHYRHNVHHRRHYRRNPERGLSIAGVSLPSLDTIAWVGSGLVLPGIITSYVTPYIPASFQGTWTNFAVKGVVGVIIPGMVIKRVVNARAGNLYMIGGLASLTIDVLRTLGVPGLGQWQPMLGGYFSYPQAPGRIVGLPRRTVAAQLPPMISEAPDRLNPASRF